MKLLIVANWKMNPKKLSQAREYFLKLREKIKRTKKAKIVICPPFIYLSRLLELQGDDPQIEFGVQNCFWEDEGAFTGEISPLMIKNLGIKYAILGHSERRRYLKEDDQMIAKKVAMTLRTRLSPILCIGETKEEREKERFGEVLKFQLEYPLKAIDSQIHRSLDLIIAYEPTWAIGTGNFCPPEMTREMLIYIKRLLSNHLPKAFKKIKILYGGSVDSKNAKSYIDVGFSGLLVGGASLKVQEFVKIIKNVTS